MRTAPEKTRNDDSRYDFQFQTRPKPEMVQRTTTLLSIYMRRNQLAAYDHPTWETKTTADDADNDEVNIRPASVSFEAETHAGLEDLCEDGARSRERADIIRLGRTQGATYPVGGKNQGNDLMKDILHSKYKKKKKRRKPFEDRLADFYESVDEIKVVDDTKDLSEWEQRRRWMVLTKGVKAALAESSDEDDAPTNMQTV